MALTVKAVEAAKWKGKDYRLADRDGLYLQVRRSSKTWIIRSRKGGRTSITTVGKIGIVSLKEARVEAANQKNQNTHTVTVETLVEKYMAEVVEKNHKRPELAQGYMARCVIPKIGPRKVRDIEKADLVVLIQDYAKRGGRTADQLRSNLMSLFGYAAELGFTDTNPMIGVTRRVSGYKPQARARVLNDGELRQVWNEESQNARVLRFLLLTGLRIVEAQKGHQDGDKWVVPDSISKNGKAHWVYLTKTATAQLPLPRCTPTNIQAWLRRWCEKHKIEPRFTPHDCRRTAATRMADNEIEPFIVERVLNHSLQGVMEVYNKAEYEKERIATAKVLEKCLLDVVGGKL